MTTIHHLDIQKAVDQFCANIEKLAHLPLITDEEMKLVYGPEVSEALASLTAFDQREKICLNCREKCCQLVDCELFHPSFTRCPIYDYRPPLCRMHFCREFAGEGNLLVKELGDIFLESLIAAGGKGSQKALLFDSPPLARFLPELVESIRRDKEIE